MQTKITIKLIPSQQDYNHTHCRPATTELAIGIWIIKRLNGTERRRFNITLISFITRISCGKLTRLLGGSRVHHYDLWGRGRESAAIKSNEKLRKKRPRRQIKSDFAFVLTHSNESDFFCVSSKCGPIITEEASVSSHQMSFQRACSFLSSSLLGMILFGHRQLSVHFWLSSFFFLFALIVQLMLYYGNLS